MRNACRKDESRGGIRQCANSKRSYMHSLLTDLLNFTLFQCSVVVGKHSPVNLPNADVAARPSIVERIVKVPLGARGTDFGVAPRTPRTMAIITITTGNGGLVLELLEMVEHL